MTKLPDGLVQKGGTPTFTNETLPAALLNEHSLAEERWGLLHVLEGSVIFVDLATQTETTLSAPTTHRIDPVVLHKLRLAGPLKVRIDFYRPAD